MAFSEPEEIIKLLNLKSGYKVADIGAGSGFYAVLAARLVGTSGKVYAIDVQQDLIDRLLNEAKHKGLSNIEGVWGNAEENYGTRLRDQSIDVVIIANVLFQVEHKSAFLSEAARILVPGGKLLLVDWSESFGNLGPSPAHVVSKDAAEKLLVSSGFVVEDIPIAGAHHYAFIVKKPVSHEI